ERLQGSLRRCEEEPPSSAWRAPALFLLAGIVRRSPPRPLRISRRWPRAPIVAVGTR
ncbi:unnamed protein product, partial [Musa hybrid cultivar]